MQRKTEPPAGRRCGSSHLVAGQPALQQQAEAVACLLVVLQALTQATVVVLHEPAVHDHLQLA